ncbi:mitogen-activated protein kinase 18 isoform X2 [Capsicum annuum]
MIYFNHLSEMMLHPHSGKDQPLSHWKPLFSGKSVVHQLDLITDLHGTPSADIISGVRNEKARKYLTDMKKKSPVPFTKKFQKADLLALRLLQRLWLIRTSKDWPRLRGEIDTTLDGVDTQDIT